MPGDGPRDSSQGKEKRKLSELDSFVPLPGVEDLKTDKDFEQIRRELEEIKSEVLRRRDLRSFVVGVLSSLVAALIWLGLSNVLAPKAEAKLPIPQERVVGSR